MSGEGEGQNGADRSWIPEDLRSVPGLEKFKEPGAVVRGYVELEKKAGRYMLPGDGADDATWEAHHAARRPSSPDDYGLKTPEGGDESFVKWFTGRAHAHGLDKRQVAGLFQDYLTEQDRRIKEGTEGSAKAVEELVKSWGTDAEKRKAAATRAIAALDLDGLGIENHPKLLKALSEVGLKMTEDKSPAGTSSGADSLGSVRDEIRKLQSSAEYHSVDWQVRTAAMAKMDDLTRREIELEAAVRK